MGDKYNTTISNSNVGASAVGPGASAQGNVTLNAELVSQVEYDEHIRSVQKALVDDQDRLEELSAGLYEALGQFLRMARQIQVDQETIARVQAQMKETLDEVWAEQVAGKLKGKAIPATLEFAKTLLGSPVTAEVAKSWLGVP